MRLHDTGRGVLTGHSHEPLYGTTYLPRKFKIGVTVPGDNSIDVLTNDLGAPHAALARCSVATSLPVQRCVSLTVARGVAWARCRAASATSGRTWQRDLVPLSSRSQHRTVILCLSTPLASAAPPRQALSC